MCDAFNLQLKCWRNMSRRGLSCRLSCRVRVQSEFHPKTWLTHASNSWSSGTWTTHYLPPPPENRLYQPNRLNRLNRFGTQFVFQFIARRRERAKSFLHIIAKVLASSSYPPLYATPLLIPAWVYPSYHPSIYSFIHGECRDNNNYKLLWIDWLAMPIN